MAYDTFINSGRLRTGKHAYELTVDTLRLRDGRKVWTKLWFEAAEHAHDRRRASEAIGANTVRNTGMDPETASGVHTYQAELPFFMQSGLGKR